jgi:glycosyltransferase involved in cell wall biosynthesis
MPSRTAAASSGHGEEMRIGIDFHAAEREGTGNCTYIRNVVEQIVRLAPKHEYFLYITDVRNPYYERFGGQGQVHLTVIPSHSPFIRMPLLGLQTFRDRIDVLHATYYGPPFYRGKLLLTVHDLAFLHVPDSFSRFDRIKDRLLVPFYMRKAQAVLTVSDYSRRDIVDTYHLPYERVSVSYNGVDPSFSPAEDRISAQRILEGYGLSGDAGYILFVGRINKRKNLTTLVKCFNIVKGAKGLSQRLVIAGNKDFLPADDKAAISTSPYIDDIRFTGFVPHHHLPTLYSLADLFVYPSLYEGFGLPCLEAMACGCPVISSACTSLPEVVGDAGMLIDPEDVDALADAVYIMLSDKSVREECVKKGLKKAREFTWESAAAAMVGVLNGLAKNN